MNHYKMRVEPTDGRPPAVWEGDAINFMDACTKARRMFDASYDARLDVVLPVRSFSETSQLIARLPLVPISGA